VKGGVSVGSSAAVRDVVDEVYTLVIIGQLDTLELLGFFCLFSPTRLGDDGRDSVWLDVVELLLLGCVAIEAKLWYGVCSLP
jgi:hypothetical protein